MPLYEYVCTSCKKHFEVKALMKDTVALLGCPDCGSPATKQPSVFTFTFTQKN